ncbi:MAG: hypothetical protein ACKVWV_11460 [Planctomycetota bacterium]
MNRAEALRRVCVVFLALAACHAVESPARTRWIVPPLFEPHSFRIETELFDVPADLAGEFGPALAEDDELIGFRIDETGRHDALVQRAAADARIVRATRPEVVVRSGERAPLSARSADAATQSLESDRVSLVVGAAIGSSWAPIDFQLRATWLDEHGRTIAAVEGATPLPSGYRIQSFLLPPSRRANGTAVLGFFHVESIFDDCSAPATLDPGDGIASAVGRLSNVGSVPIRFCVAGDRVPRRIELGDMGAARWDGDGRELEVVAGAEAVFTCTGDGNRVRATASGGTLTFDGAHNACANEANGAGGTRFVSRPARAGDVNAIDVGGESGNELQGPWQPQLDPIRPGG